MWRKRVARVGRKKALFSQMAQNLFLKVIWVGVSGSAALAGLFVWGPPHKPKLWPQELSTGYLEGQGRQRVSLRLRLLATALASRAGTDLEGASSAWSSTRQGPRGAPLHAGQWVLGSDLPTEVISIFHNQATVPAHTTVLTSAHFRWNTLNEILNLRFPRSKLNIIRCCRKCYPNFGVCPKDSRSKVNHDV